jgi:hypothetical protein
MVATDLSGSELQAIFPSGAKAGSITQVAFHGAGLESAVGARCQHPGIQFVKRPDGTFAAQVAEDVPTGLYDVQVMTAAAISSSRLFFVTNYNHVVEGEPDSTGTLVQDVRMGCAISGRIAKGDTDEFRFTAKRGERIVIECWADRIDSSLRGILEVRNTTETLLASSRGYFGIDPAIPFTVPADGEYTVRLHDLIFAGGPTHFYRLDIHTGPRIVFALPPIVQRDATTAVSLFGWNLTQDSDVQSTDVQSTDVQSTADQSTADQSTSVEKLSSRIDEFDVVRVDVAHADKGPASPIRRLAEQAGVPTFAFYTTGCDSPVTLGLSDNPVGVAFQKNDSPSTAILLGVPSETAGQLSQSRRRDWYAIDARGGEVFYLEATGHRLASPVDLDVSIHGDAVGNIADGNILARFQDNSQGAADIRFPASHLDPSGRWVAPRDGRFLVSVRNLIGGIEDDSRRVYSLSVRREEPAVSLVAIPRGGKPTGVNVQRGGQTVVDVKAFRRRGMSQSIRVSARNLPAGLRVDDVWLGPGVDSVPLVISANEDCQDLVASLELVGTTVDSGQSQREWQVQSGSMIRAGVPEGSGRLTQGLPVMVAGLSPIRLLADGHEPLKHQLYGELKVRHSPGGILDVAVKAERTEAGHHAPVKLSAIGLPESIEQQVATIPEGEDQGHVSFYLPKTLPLGTYTIVIRGQTTVQAPKGSVEVFSTPVTFTVEAPAFRLDVDRSSPRAIGRGQVVQISYSARRINGFIGKIHTELAIPGAVTEVGRLRARGVTFVGQTETGTIQIIANEDAELGHIPFLRLYAVGVVEDEPVYHGCCFLELETVE